MNDKPSKLESFRTQIALLFQQRRVKAFAAIAVLAIIALLTTLIVVNNDDSDSSVQPLTELTGLTGLSPQTDYVYQPAKSAGPDSFSPSYAVYTLNVPTETLESGLVSGSATGLYGGTEENACDVEKLIAFLEANPAIGAAWAEVQGIPVDELADYIQGLTPAVLLQNALVMNHGYSNGEAIPF
ncbi:MAG: hypothetical protein P8L22_05635, partial [Acidimicrobiales bacterium]|nr:hypothetical protein [Acidimicrobiales bacterium]